MNWTPRIFALELVGVWLLAGGALPVSGESADVDAAMKSALADLHSTRWLQRLEGLRKIGDLGQRGRPAAPQVMALLQSKEEEDEVRAASAVTLGEIGAIDAVPALLGAAADRSVGNSAIRGLVRMGPAVIPALEPFYVEEDGSVAKVLAQLGEPALPAIKVALQQPERRVAGASAAFYLGDRAVCLVPELIVAATDKQAQVRGLAVQALGQLGPKATAAVPVLTASLDDSDEYVRDVAIGALGRIGPGAIAARSRLERFLAAPDTHLREIVQTALMQIGTTR